MNISLLAVKIIPKFTRTPVVKLFALYWKTCSALLAIMHNQCGRHLWDEYCTLLLKCGYGMWVS